MVARSIPQGLEPGAFIKRYGTTEVVPFPSLVLFRNL